MQPVFGTETEYAVSAVQGLGSVRPDARELAGALVNVVADRYPSVVAPPPHPHIMLGNGGCVYRDTGGHPEACSAECSDPEDLAAQELALRAMLREAAQAVGSTYGVRVRLLANNVDYATEAHTFGHHVNLLASAKLSYMKIEQQLVPLLVALPLIHGTGRISSTWLARGFEISQRAGFMFRATGKRTTDARALITAKDESLAGRSWQRVHVIAIDTPMSPVCMYLVPAILSLALMDLEAEKKGVGSRFVLADPIDALRTVSSDLTLNSALTLKDGGTTTALAILHAYCDTAGELARAKDAPSWVGSVVSLWSDILSHLATDPLKEWRLDWPIKYGLLSGLLGQLGISWPVVTKWHRVLGFIRHVLWAKQSTRLTDLDSFDAAAKALPRSVVGVLQTQMHREVLDWADLPAAVQVLNQLGETCLRYHDTSDDNGLWQQICGTTLVRDIVPPDVIERAKTSPPANTRARIRGAEICKGHEGTRAWWTFIDTPTQRLQMDDPHGQSAKWVAKNVRATAGRKGAHA